MSPLKLLSQDKIGDFLNLLPIPRENLRTIDFCLGSFAWYMQGRIQDLAMGGGGPRFVGKRVTYTSEVSYERSEYKSAGGTGGAVSPPRILLNLEPLRVNLSVIWQIIS